jgi:translocation and assembly module TamA
VSSLRGVRFHAFVAQSLVLILAASHPAHADRVRVEVIGVSGELRKNVLGFLSIDDATGDLSEPTVRHLHARASEEIAEALEPFGFYRPAIRPQLTHEGGAWDARYRVDPGKAIQLDTMDVRITGEGADDPDFRRIVERFPLRVGDALRHAAYVRGRDAIVQQAARGGYLDGRFEISHVSVDLDRYGAAIHLHYETGPRFRFGEVRFDQAALAPDLLRRYVRFREGDPFDYEKLLRLQEALLASTYFRGAEVVPRRDLAEGLEVPVEVRLLPAEPRRLTWGLGFGSDEGASARAGLVLGRLNRHGHRAEIQGTISQIERSSTAQYQIPWTDPRTDMLTLSAGWSELRPTTSRTTRYIAAAALRRLLGDWTRTLTLSFNHERFRIGSEDRISRFLIPSANWSYLRADSRIFTTTGYRIDLDARGTTEPLGQASFLRLLTRGKWIESPTARNRLLLRGDVGTTWASEFEPLPPTLRFFAGGAHSVRGFEFLGLGPRDGTGAVIGGPHLLVGSIEFDHRLLERWLVAAFYDIGSALFRRGDPVEDAAGVGLRWISPVGPIRLDAAMPLHEPGKRVRLHLSLGPDL